MMSWKTPPTDLYPEPRGYCGYVNNGDAKNNPLGIPASSSHNTSTILLANPNLNPIPDTNPLAFRHFTKLHTRGLRYILWPYA